MNPCKHTLLPPWRVASKAYHKGAYRNQYSHVALIDKDRHRKRLESSSPLGYSYCPKRSRLQYKNDVVAPRIYL